MIITLVKTIPRLIVRGLQWDRLKVDCDIMRMDAVKLLRVYDAATYYREAVEKTDAGEWIGDERARCFENLCRALDAAGGE